MSNRSDDARTASAGTRRDATPIEEAHRALNRRLHEVASATDSSSLLDALTGLPKMLAEHFAEEESPQGFYEQVEAMRPSMHAELAVLRREHVAMLRDLDELMRQLQTESTAAGAGTEPPFPESRVDELLVRLRRHERRESTLIADVYYADEGASG